MNPEQYPTPKQPKPASGKRHIAAPTLVSPELLAANPDELPTTPRIAEIPNEEVISVVEPEESGVQQQAEQKRLERLSRDLQIVSDVAEQIKNQLASHETLSRDALLDAKNDLNQHEAYLATLFKNAFQGNTVEDTEQRREIQDTLLYIQDIKQQLRERMNEIRSSFVEENPYLSEGEADRLERLRAWVGTPNAPETIIQHKADSVRGRLQELEAQTPDTEQEAAHRQTAINTLRALMGQLTPTEQIPSALDAEIDLLRQQVMKKYGKPPEEIEPEDIEQEGILAHTRNAMAALTGNLDYVRQNEDPFQKWEKLIQQKAMRAHQERATEPAQRKRKKAA